MKKMLIMVAILLAGNAVHAADKLAADSIGTEDNQLLQLDETYRYVVGFRDIDRISVEGMRPEAQTRLVKFRQSDKKPVMVAEYKGDFYAHLIPGDYVLISSSPINKALKK